MPKGKGYNSTKKRAIRTYTWKYGTTAQKNKILAKAKKRSQKRKRK